MGMTHLNKAGLFSLCVHYGPGYSDYTFDQKTAHIGINGQSHIAMEGAKKISGHY